MRTKKFFSLQNTGKKQFKIFKRIKNRFVNKIELNIGQIVNNIFYKILLS